MNVIDMYNAEKRRNNEPITVFAHPEMGEVQVRALPISQADEWCAMVRATEPLEREFQRTLQAKMADADNEAAPVEGEETPSETFARARAAYYEAVKKCVERYLGMQMKTVDLDQLTWAQIIDAFNIMYTISDPTQVSMLSQMETNRSVMSGVIRKPNGGMTS